MAKQPKIRTDDRESFTVHARYFECVPAADDIGAGLAPPVPLAEFSRALHEGGRSRIVHLDLSQALGCAGPATSPSLCASFVRVAPGEPITTRADASSELFHVIRGEGHTRVGDARIPWNKGDCFTLPGRSVAEHFATGDTAFYWVHDQPLLNHLGVTAERARFEPTLYPREHALAELRKAEQGARSGEPNSVRVILANDAFPVIRTATPVLSATLGFMPAGAVQRPHRHPSVALDFIIDCQPGCYTLLGERVDDRGGIEGARRIDWEPASAFVAPPGHWHEHHNETGAPAHLLQIQDAGLHAYLRTLHIRLVLTAAARARAA
jgi:gentisate 1,2-dioxygenase